MLEALMACHERASTNRTGTANDGLPVSDRRRSSTDQRRWIASAPSARPAQIMQLKKTPGR
jgi:hypothetical protein